MVIKTTEEGYVDTEKAIQHWESQKDFNGRDWVYRSPQRSPWIKETLYKSSKENYYTVTVQSAGAPPTARFLSYREAAAWLRLNDYDLPDDLKDYDPTE